MARRVPSYLHHKPSGQARVILPRPDGTRDTIYLGAFGSAESKARYAQVIAEMSGGGRPPAAVPPPRPAAGAASVNEVVLAFWQHVTAYYVGLDGRPTTEQMEYRQTLRVLRVLFGGTPAADFGPLKLAAVRAEMVNAGWCRKLVNRRVDRVRRCFKWAVSQELVPGDRYEALRTLAGLRAGRTAARETAAVGPVDPGVVAATLPHLPRVLRAMVEAQRWAGMRPGDVCRITAGAVDRSGPVWAYRPALHKTAYRGAARVIPLGPRAQAVLRPFLDAAAGPDVPLFSPAAVVAEFHAGRSAARKTPLYDSHAARNAGKRATASKRSTAEHHNNLSYGKAVAAGIAKANAWRKAMAAGGEFDPVPTWSPNQFRHLRGTEVRKASGLEVAQVLHGPDWADVTQVYTDRLAAGTG